jgi:hypothetical protein
MSVTCFVPHSQWWPHTLEGNIKMDLAVTEFELDSTHNKANGGLFVNTATATASRKAITLSPPD